MNTVFRRVPTFLFLFLITGFLSNCSSGHSPLIGEVNNPNPTGTPVVTGTPTDTPTDIPQAPSVCSDDSTCAAEQKCVEGVCREKHSLFGLKATPSLSLYNKCHVGKNECSETEYCHSDNPHTQLGTCQNKKVISTSCVSNWECQSDYCAQDPEHDEKICSPIFGNNSSAEDGSGLYTLSYYLSKDSKTLYSNCTNPNDPTCDSVNPDFEDVPKEQCSGNAFDGYLNVIVGLKVTVDKDNNGIQEIKVDCQNINDTLSNKTSPWGSSSQGLVDGYFYGNKGEFISGFWIKDANGEHAVVELQPYFAKIKTVNPLVYSEIISPTTSWGPGDGAIDSFELHCDPGSAMVSIGGRKFEGFYRSLELECRKIEIAIKTGHKDEKK